MKDIFPSIWLGEFRSKSEYDAQKDSLAEALSVYDWIDDRILFSRHPFSYPAYCSACGCVTQIRIDWRFAAGDNLSPSIHPAWTETGFCENCGLNSRMRAVVDFLRNKINLKKIRSAYIAEQVTPLYRVLKHIIPSLVGSEYLGPGYPSGTVHMNWKYLQMIRHEDLTSLSFADGTFDLAITLDVFEHIPAYKKAFAELWRILSPGGVLVFTIPFFPDRETTMIRATVNKNGEIIHHLPPEIHGNPISTEGALCFQNFGWDILSDLRKVGFSDAIAHLYWGPWKGHLGFPFFVFSAFKA
ncbi:MAG: class I SAM-dependent methyltransferase [Candidatus Bathyarchaeia archaeon]